MAINLYSPLPTIWLYIFICLGWKVNLRHFHLAFPSMIAVILPTKYAKWGLGQLQNRSFQLYIGRLTMDAVDLYKLDIGQDYIYYLATIIRPTVTWEPWWFRSWAINNNSGPMSNCHQMSISFSLMHSYQSLLCVLAMILQYFSSYGPSHLFCQQLWVWKLAQVQKSGKGLWTFTGATALSFVVVHCLFLLLV